MGLNWSTAEIARILGGQVHGEDVPVDGMIHDTRRMSPGALFLALKGAHSDGHDHIATARETGAAAALVCRPVDDPLPQVVVEDVLLAAGQLAGAWRASLDVEIIGITGSNGKTSVKEMVSAILSAQAATLTTEGNYNNEIGVPITLSRLSPEHVYAVVEMGAARQGDIRYLTHMVKPKVGILTNAGPAHLESFGSIETIVQTKGELFRGLSDDGTAIINADSPYVRHWRDLAAHCHSLHFALDHEAEFRASLPKDYQMGQAVPITTPEGEATLRLTVPGAHNVMNALASIAACSVFGISVDNAIAALAKMKSVNQRLQIHRPKETITLIDDSYNANPASTEAGVRVLAEQPGRRWLVFGDMLELGADGPAMHASIGETAKALGIEQVFGFGSLTQATVQAFGAQGQWFDDQQALIDALSEALLAEPTQPVSLLIKGSRSMRMDRVVAALLGALT